MKNQFTPGPWTVHKGSAPLANRIVTFEPVPLVIAELTTSGETMKTQWEANARLIAAAPDLLKVLEIALVYLDHEAVQNIGFAVNPFVVANYAKEVIAKVKGE